MSRGDIVKVAVIVLVLIAAVWLFGQINVKQGSAETNIVRDAIRDAAITCYAVEGAYPDSVSYLREHYQLAYDENRYYVTYESFASNRMPNIYVTERGTGIR